MSSREEDPWDGRCLGHRIRGMIRVSAAGLQGKSFSQTLVSHQLLFPIGHGLAIRRTYLKRHVDVTSADLAVHAFPGNRLPW